MSEDFEYRLVARLRVNLAGLSGDLHRHLQELMNFVALGLKAADGAGEEVRTLPDVEIPQVLSKAAELWDSDTLRSKFRRWILAAGVRDAVESFSMVLEDARQILAAWSLSLAGERVPVELWNTRFVEENHKFHRRGLPDKLDFLRREYSISLSKPKEEYLLSINRARNCLVHRGGIVAFPDLVANQGEISEAIRTRRAASPTEPWTREQVKAALLGAGIEPYLQVKWLRLKLFLQQGDDRTYIDLRQGPFKSTGGFLGMEVQLVERQFEVGEPLVVDSNEFSEIAWTLSNCARNLTEAIERRGRDLGVPFDLDSTDEDTY
jgi:hypothetical protein